MYVSLVFLIMLYVLFFFFSSRRRHTRFDCDWSSDVCSSDLRLIVRRLYAFHFEKGKPSLAVNIERGGQIPHFFVGVVQVRLCQGEQLLLQGHRFPKERSEEHTSELQSQSNLVCRLLLEKKKYN